MARARHLDEMCHAVGERVRRAELPNGIVEWSSPRVDVLSAKAFSNFHSRIVAEHGGERGGFVFLHMSHVLPPELSVC